MPTEFSTSLINNLLAVVASVVAVAAYVYAAQRLLLRSRYRRQQRAAELRATISKGFLDGTLESVDDLINVYKGVNNLGADDASYRAGLGRALREYLVGIVTDTALSADQVRQLKATATRYLEQIERETPFADLPAAERNLLTDIERFIDAGDRDATQGKLEDLAGLVEVRQDALDKAQASVRWSIPLAVVGVILTVVFGVISLFK